MHVDNDMRTLTCLQDGGRVGVGNEDNYILHTRTPPPGVPWLVT